jgi:4-hydroxy-L-threonine phosphate dehydrogenase PdxA
VSGRARRRVRLAVTMGDPAGIGPEVTLKAITTRAVAAEIDPILVGDPGDWACACGSARAAPAARPAPWRW